jgi:hypothetical protein
LNRSDITFPNKDDSWVLYSGTIAKNLVTFSSDNESIATFVDGKVVAVGSGTTKVHAEYNGEKVSCIIRCVFQQSSGVGQNIGVAQGAESGQTHQGCPQGHQIHDYQLQQVVFYKKHHLF